MAIEKVTGVRLTDSERKKLKRIGKGNITDAIRTAIALLFQKETQTT